MSETPTSTDRAAVPAASPTVTSTETASPEVEKLIENMPLKQKVTQMIMPDFRKWQEANQESPQDLTKVNAEVADAIDNMILEASFFLLKTSKRPSRPWL